MTRRAESAPKPLASLGWRTDLFVLGRGAEIRVRPDYHVARCPDQPNFLWGNFVVFRKPPAEGDLARWRRLFAEEFADLPGLRHETLGWDTTTGERGCIDPFLAAGFALEEMTVLVLDRTDLTARPIHGSSDLDLRPIASDMDWALVVALQTSALGGGDVGKGADSSFATMRMKACRGLVQAGRGLWWGAWDRGSGRLVGSLGLFYGTEGLARYHEVLTAPDWRRRGVCTTLMDRSAREALARPDLERLVITSAPDGPPQRIYEGLGFRLIERQVGLLRRPPRRDPA